MKENSKSKFFKVQNIRKINYWILGIWSVLRILDYLFTYIAISLGLGFEINPIGFNYILFLVGFAPICAILIINYKIHNMKEALYTIFFCTLILTIIQVIVTLNVMSGGLIDSFLF